jgi:tetratricopeptide (TPR) repeat protein
MGRGPLERIDGWKSIAAELGRDRSTAIRWAKERGLPVHAVPGGKSRSVYALRHELNAWMRGQDVEDPEDKPAPTPADIRANVPRLDDTASGDDLVAVSVRAPIENEAEPDATPGLRPLVRLRRIVAVSGTVGVLVAVLAASGRLERTPAALAAPASSQLVQARDDLATRSEGRLDMARATLTMLAQRHPDNAPIQEALADAWVLAREYGSEPDALAFDRAGAAAAAARRIDPASAGADRVEGVVAYWWDRDPVRAGIAFRRAIVRAPQDPLAHLWYANILTDNGEDAAAEREFTAARTLLPGAPYLLADYAWGLWSAGKDADAVARLKMLSAYPHLASVPDCLSVIALATGNVTEYARYLRARAATRRHAELTAYSQAVDRALALGGTAGRQAAYAVMLSRAISLAENANHPDHSWPAFVAHSAGDQAQLLAILHEARAHGEHWGAAGFVRRMRVRWEGDAAILRELDELAQPHIEQLGKATKNPL